MRAAVPKGSPSQRAGPLCRRAAALKNGLKNGAALKQRGLQNELQRQNERQQQRAG